MCKLQSALYTCDIDISKLKVEENEEHFASLQEKKKYKVRGRVLRDRMREMAFSRVAPICALFETDDDFKQAIGTYPLVRVDHS